MAKYEFYYYLEDAANPCSIRELLAENDQYAFNAYDQEQDFLSAVNDDLSVKLFKDGIDMHEAFLANLRNQSA